MHELEDKTLLLLVAGVSLLFAWVVWPFSGAVLWAVVLATLFAPMHRRTLGLLPGWPNGAAMLTLLTVIVAVILPVAFVTSMLAQEAADAYRAFQSGEISIGDWMRQAREAMLAWMPAWAADLLARLGGWDLPALRERLNALMTEVGPSIAGKAINLGQGTLDLLIGVCVMLYLLYFLLRDGPALRRRIGDAIPLRADRKAELAEQFAVTIRAIVKGSLVVALVQGALGGAMFWFLGIGAPVVWAVCMAVFALLPLVGTGLVWVPAALYLMVGGEVWKGIALVGYGVLVIGLVDNVLRPILVGKDTQMPDYLVLIATLGGISVFGVHGLVIGPVSAAMLLATWHVFGRWRAERSL